MHQIALKLMLLLINNKQEKISLKNQDRQNIFCACVTTLQSCYMKNALVFS